MPRLRLALSAAAHLAILRAALLVVPLERLTELLGLGVSAPTGEAPAAGGALDDRSREVVWAVVAAGRRMPLVSTCLTRSLAGHLMLRRRHLASQVHLGVARDGRGRTVFHSWLTCGARVVLGEDEIPYWELALYS